MMAFDTAGTTLSGRSGCLPPAENLDRRIWTRTFWPPDACPLCMAFVKLLEIGVNVMQNLRCALILAFIGARMVLEKHLVRT